MDTRYLYEVRPVKPIVLPGRQPINRPCSILLTRDEVMEYMKSGAVYRKFTDINIEPIKVTGENISKLHQSSYDPNYNTVDIQPVVEDVDYSNDAATETQEDEQGKKIGEEESIVLGKVDESSTVSDKDNVEETVKEEVKDAEKEDEIVSTEESEGNDEKIDESASDDSEQSENTPADKDDAEETVKEEVKVADASANKQKVQFTSNNQNNHNDGKKK